ncbi:hypothetical protein KW803_01905 [Candidatus Saccharibacteria bacterium]|nr:hypothetical protein [Candidatus Saccharibacteria bacterium]
MQKIKTVILAVFSLVLLIAAPLVVNAQTTTGTTTGSGLSISPTISEFTLKPGASANVTITLKNITVDKVVAKGVVNDFTADNATGNPKILTNSTTPSPNSIQNFVYNLDDVPLARGQQKNVILGLQIPAGTTPGAYYGIIRYTAVPAGTVAPGPGQVALTASVGTIVLITVPGNIREQVQVAGLHVYRDDREGTVFLNPPNKIGIEIKNFGNGFVRPFGTVEVHNMFNKTITTYQFNNPKQLGNILPNSSRIFTQNIKGINQPGRYTVTSSVSYGSGSQVLTLTKDFWYIPLWLLIIIAVVLLSLIYLIYRTYRRYKRSKRHSRRQ